MKINIGIQFIQVKYKLVNFDLKSLPILGVRLKYKKWRNGAKSGETEQKLQKVTKRKQKVMKRNKK